jgi:hypothetical protein
MLQDVVDAAQAEASLIASRGDGDDLADEDTQLLGRDLATVVDGMIQQASNRRRDVASTPGGDPQVPAQGGGGDLEP